MGLDMYLYRKQHYGFNDGIKEAKIIDKEGKEKAVIPAGRHDMLHIETNIAYWRKANQVHNWFVEVCGGGEDECQDIYVDKEKLEELLAICKEIKSKAKMVKAYAKNGSGSISGDKVVEKVVPIFGGEGDERYLAEVKATGEEVKYADLKPGDWYKFDHEFCGETVAEKVKAGLDDHYTMGEIMVNAERIADLLPTTSGFFFGSTDYDCYYMADIDDTIKQLEEVLADHKKLVESGLKEYDIDYIYRASW